MQKFQVSRGTVQRAKKQTTELMYQKENNRNTKISRLHNTTPLNTLVFRWFSLVRLQGFPISGPIMQEKAKQLALLLGIDNFHASDGWLASFKKRNIISLRAISGESGNADISVAETWKNSLQSLCVGYDSKTFLIWTRRDISTGHFRIRLWKSKRNHAREENFRKIALR